MKNVLLLLLVPLFFAVTLAQDAPITNREIIALLKEGISEDLILHKIQTSGCKCRTTAMDIMTLKGSGASETLISGIISQGHRTATSPARPRSPQIPQIPQIPNSELEEPTFATVFGGYTYGYTRGDFGGAHWNGWNVATSFAINDWLSIAGDVSGHYLPDFPDPIVCLGCFIRVDSSIYTFAAGPQVSTWDRTRKVRGFGHVMVGGGHRNRHVVEERNGLSIVGFSGEPVTQGIGVSPVLLIGGGLDVGVSKHMALRVFQSDWVHHFGDDRFDMFRLSFGVVGRF